MKKQIEDKKITDQLNKKHDMSQDNVKLLKDMEKLEEKYKTNISKMTRVDERVKPKILDKVSKMALGEYQELSRVYKDGDNWYMEFADRLEEFKKMFKDRSKKEDKKEDKKK